MWFAIFWVILAFVVGAVGENRKIGFGGGFFASLILSPIVGIILVAFSEKRDPGAERAMGQYENGMFALNRGKYDKAKEYFKKAVDGRPDNSPDSCFCLALLYARENDQEGTLFWLKKALKSGYNDLDQLRGNDLLEKVRGTEQYQRMMLEFT